MIQKLKTALWWFYNREDFLIMEDAVFKHQEREDRYKEVIDFLLRNNEKDFEAVVTKFLQTGEWL